MRIELRGEGFTADANCLLPKATCFIRQATIRQHHSKVMDRVDVVRHLCQHVLEDRLGTDKFAPFTEFAAGVELIHDLTMSPGVYEFPL